MNGKPACTNGQTHALIKNIAYFTMKPRFWQRKQSKGGAVHDAFFCSRTVFLCPRYIRFIWSNHLYRCPFCWHGSIIQNLSRKQNTVWHIFYSFIDLRRFSFQMQRKISEKIVRQRIVLCQTIRRTCLTQSP